MKWERARIMLAIRQAASYLQRNGGDGHPDHRHGLVGDRATADQHSEEFRTPAPLTTSLCGFVDATIAVELPVRTLSGRNWF
jgi:hypothetical protein